MNADIFDAMRLLIFYVFGSDSGAEQLILINKNNESAVHHCVMRLHFTRDRIDTAIDYPCRVFELLLADLNFTVSSFCEQKTDIFKIS
jgi:hypothetical protein